MKKMKKYCCGALIAGFMLTQVAVYGGYSSEAASGVWKENKNGWYYEYSNGTYAKSEWLKIGGKWYYFNARGYMVKNWQKIGKKWYYFGTDGKMKSGWQKISGKWYYFASGAMSTGWKKLSGKWYYFNSDGSMVTGDKTIGGVKYSFDENGVMKEGASDQSDSKNSALSKAKVGSIIKFGHYEQDGNESNGKEPIEWIVLEKKKDGSLFVISKLCLEHKAFEEEENRATWETCSLRKWLNGTFMDIAFDATEKNKIATTALTNNKHPFYGTPSGRNTKDKVFLLSVDEAMKFFASSDGTHDDIFKESEKRAAKPTQYQINDGKLWMHKSGSEWYIGNCSWLLRTSDGSGYGGEYNNNAVATVNEKGAINGTHISWSYFGIRPAMVIMP